MLQLKATPYKIRLKYPFTTSRYTVTEQETLVVSISDGEYTGYGEATANPYYNSTIRSLVEAVEYVSQKIDKTTDYQPNEFWELIEPDLRDNYFALCAIDCAYWDFYGKKQGYRLIDEWFSGNLTKIRSSYTIGLDKTEAMLQKITDNPWPIYKIKLGTQNDVDIMKQISNHTQAKLRIDANCAWTPKETVENSVKLKEMGIEFIEQPLPYEDWAGMKFCQEHSVLPIIADESFRRIEDLEKCAEHFNGINIKLMKCGGLTPALRIVELARNLGIKIMAGCMTESTVGISSLLQLAPALDYLDADGAKLLKEDIATGSTIISDGIQYSSIHGTGVSLTL